MFSSRQAIDSVRSRHRDTSCPQNYKNPTRPEGGSGRQSRQSHWKLESPTAPDPCLVHRESGCLRRSETSASGGSCEWWRRRESNPRPKVRPRGTLHAYPLLLSHARREEAAQNRRPPDPVKSRHWTPGRHPIASLFNGIWPPTTRRGQGRRSQLIKLRERTVYPQLTDVPSDLRVNGARHASRESLPPSKPCRPQTEVARTSEDLAILR